ncbi:hypothetical protein MMB75_25395 [Paenibacillus sp. P2(2022)]|uniref:hypothetical protein n=1 Tax=Paenibacillus sp. P2(2022) TaxID=2917813 RepID=UPI002404DEA1|nr:hypothetical protein [Paenibacillus sp. P2(2022)]MDG0056964.1 hypothetical protein [Paenibacillus sp. P2(2022)]
MEHFESVFDAVRHIKDKLDSIDDHEELYLMCNEDCENFWVTDENSELEEEMGKSFYDWGYESSDPDKHAESFKLWAYVLKENKERYPGLYKNYKESPLSKNHIRGRISPSGEVAAIFSVRPY